MLQTPSRPYLGRVLDYCNNRGYDAHGVGIRRQAGKRVDVENTEEGEGECEMCCAEKVDEDDVEGCVVGFVGVFPLRYWKDDRPENKAMNYGKLLDSCLGGEI